MRLIISLIILSLMGIQTASAFGKTGHRVVGEIAERHLTAAARAKVKTILGMESMAEVSTWADENKSNPSKYWQKESGPLHYINVPKGKSFENSPRNPAGDVLSAYESFMATLKSKDSSKAEKAHALKFLIHIVGDMHQPMHFGHARDHGGNRVTVIWFREVTNLHSVWDTHLIEGEKLSFTEWANSLDKASPDQVARYQKANVMDWVHEGLALREGIYEVGDRNFSWNYVYKYRPLVREQLLKGGLRLAGILNKLYAQK